MQTYIVLHPFIIPDDKLVEKLKTRTTNGDLFIYPDLETAVKAQCIWCFGWVNWVDYTNGLVTFTCRVLEDTDKQLAINYKTLEDGSKDVESLYLV